MNTRFIRNIKIEADAEGNLPKTLQLLHVGNWNTPWHGDFETTEADIHEYVANYNDGVGLPEDADGLAPVNYGHKGSEKAGGWLSNIRAEYVKDRLSVVADVEYTPAGEKALREREYRYISPEFNPRALPWEDPEQEWRFVANVITGAGLTNIPLFKKLKKVAASERPDSSNQNNQGETMTLEEIRAKQVAELNDEEKAFLAEHKSELTAEELKPYGLEETDEEAAKAAADKEAADKAAVEKAAADAKAAEDQRIVEASAVLKGLTPEKLAQLQADAQAGREAKQQLAENEATTFIKASIASGRVKPDQQTDAVKLLLASKGEQRTQLEAFINGLPANKLITADELGNGKTEPVPVELSKEEETLASDFGNTPEEIAKYKETQSK
jgi:hypothetical protein